MKFVVFLKAEQLGLFDAPVNVKAATRNGKTVKPYTRVQKKRSEKQIADAQRFSDAQAGYTRPKPEAPDPDKAMRDAADLAYAKHGYQGQPDPDAAAMQRYAQGIRAEEARALKSPEFKTAVAQSEAEVAAMRKNKPPKEPRDMTASEINRRLDRLDAEGSEHSTAMIEAGRGHELPTVTFKLSDPLALKQRDNFERRSALYHEIERRYGPGAPTRLPVRAVFRKKKVANTVPRIGEKLSRYSGGHKVPSHDWETPDLQDGVLERNRVTAASVLRDYGPGPKSKDKHAIAYQAYVPMSDIPSPVLHEEDEPTDGDDQTSYDWSEYNPRNTFPPVKLEVTKDGKIQIIDGNHRLRYFDESNFTHAPAWVIDHRPNVADEADDDE